MSNVSTFGGFGTARLGIYAATKALEVVGNNISNINTENYTRQVLRQKALHVGGVDHYTMTSDVRIGAGALVTGVAQLRDPYLDIRYRNESSNVGAADAKLAGLQQLTAIFDEVCKGDQNGGVLELQMNDFFSKLQALNTSGAGRATYNNNARGSAKELVTWFNDYANQLETLKQNHETAFRQDIDRVNTVLTGIRDLNEQIRKEQIHGGDALELKDERNALIDELSGYMRINVTYVDEDIGAGMTVEKLKINMADRNSIMGGIPLIDGNYGAQISLLQTEQQKVDENGDPVVDDEGNPVMERVDDTDRYMMQVSVLKDRRDHIKAGEKDRIEKEDAKGNANILGDNVGEDYYIKVGDNYMYGSLQSTREILTEKGEYSTLDDYTIDKDCTSKRGIPYYQLALDHLARTFASWMNDANTVDPLRNPEYYYGTLDTTDPENPVFNATDKEGNPLPDGADPIVKEEHQEAYDAMKAGVLFSNDGTGNDATNITAKNLSISEGWATNKTQVVNTKDPEKVLSQSTQNDNLDHFVAIMSEKFKFRPNDVVETPGAYDGDNAYFEGTFFEMLTKINSTLAIDTKSTEEALDNYMTSQEDLYLDREGVSGVDLNDETVNMMQFQKSYTAACRLMTTIDEMLERLITGTGIVGR